jgi:hypothetical protein
MITIEALPAHGGDCLWVEWDDEESLRRRMLIDGGWGGEDSFPRALRDRFARQPVASREFDLVVCTHVDNDHIGGLLALLASPPDGFCVHDVWFNGSLRLRKASPGRFAWPSMSSGTSPASSADDLLGVRSGYRLAALLREKGLPWNLATEGSPIVVPHDGCLPTFRLPGLTLTLLSPTRDGLRALEKTWPEPEPEPPTDALGPGIRDVPWQQLANDTYIPDRSPANGSSIAFCAEYKDHSRVLFGADAHAEVLVRSLHRLQSAGRYRVDLCKMPHHGSAANISPALLGSIDCGNWLVSTQGGDLIRSTSREARYRPGEGRHPSMRAMARIIFHSTRPPTFWFNYRSASTERYDDLALAVELGFRAEYPVHAEDGIAVAVEAGEVFRCGSGFYHR